MIDERDGNETFEDIMRTGEVPTTDYTRCEFQSEVQPNVQILKPDYTDISCLDASWKSKGMPDSQFKKLSRAKPEAKHDFHYYKVDEVWLKLNSDLQQDIQQGKLVVEIVHGKGSGVLKGKIRGWLKDSDYVTAFTEVNNNSGSVVVKLRGYKS